MTASKLRQNIVFFIPTLLIIILIVCAYLFGIRYNPAHAIEVLDKNWDIQYGSNVYHNVPLNGLPSLLPDTLQKNEMIRLERTLTVEEVPSPTLALIVNHLAVEVFLDGELIGSCGMEAYAAGKFVGGNRYYIDLPASYAGKELAINYYTVEDNMIPYIYTMRLGAFHDLVFTYINEYGYVLVIGIFLCLFGSFFLVFSIVFSILLPEIKGQRLSSVLCILFGIWILTHYRVFALFTGGRYTMVAEYISFYLVLPMLYFLIIQVEETGRVFRTLALLNALLVAAAIGLHFAGIVYMHNFRNVYFVMCSLYFAYLVIKEVRMIRAGEHDTFRLLQLSGPTASCGMIFIAMIVYLLSGGDSAEYTDFSVVLLTTGPLVFAMTRFIIYIRLLVEMAPHRLEFSSLSKMAYVDALTGLSNRTQMGELAQMLNQGDHDFCIISLDLNGLKLVNDTRGHAAGDKLLKEFADTLRACFPKDAYLMRIGGDEFLVIRENAKESEVRRALEKAERQFAALDENDPDIPHSFAAGYAFRGTADMDDAHSVYMEADKRMYAQKQKMKGLS